MFKIECDNASDLTDLMRETIEAKVQARINSDLYHKESDKNYDLRNEISNLKSDLVRAQAAPTCPQYDRQLKELIAAVKAGQKINAIKVVREMTGFGLKEAKDLFEAGYDGLKVA